jgi:hypothetical protein
MGGAFQRPEMRQRDDLSPADFERHPVWIGVHNYDSDEPRYEQSDEQSFRPWTGPLPFSETRGFVLVATSFKLADGSTYSGYCRAVREDWDAAQPPAPSRSAWHGETQLSVLALLNPTIFLDRRPCDFHLGIPGRRKNRISQFYAAIRKKPTDVFPLHFAAHKGLATGIDSGGLEGFFYFPIGGESFEIDTGESMLDEDRQFTVSLEDHESSEGTRHCEGLVSGKQSKPADELLTRELRTSKDLSLADFERHPVWVLAEIDRSKPRRRHAFTPWSSSLPVDSQNEHVLISATFVLRDGSEYSGYVRAIPKNWLDITPPQLVLPRGKIILQKSPRVRFGGSPLAIVGEQLPCMFVAQQPFGFWCGVKDPDELRLPFYDALRKPPEAIFPIRFQGNPNLATGVVTGLLEGFYEIGFRDGQLPKLVR